MINIRTPEEIEKIARAGKLTADTLSFLAKNIKPGITTLDIDRMAVVVYPVKKAILVILDPSARL